MKIIKTARGGITTRHGEEAGRSRPHVGIDIGHGNETADDLRMVAPAAGRVVAAGWEGTYGYRIIIQHPDGSRSLIAHLTSMAVATGFDVEQGETIGVMGRTGGPWGSVAGWFVHGHQEYHVGGIAVDPLAYMAGGSAQTGTPTQEEDDMYTDKDRKRDDDMAWNVKQIKRTLDDANGFVTSEDGKTVTKVGESIRGRFDRILYSLEGGIDPATGKNDGRGIRAIVNRILTKTGA